MINELVKLLVIPITTSIVAIASSLYLSTLGATAKKKKEKLDAETYIAQIKAISDTLDLIDKLKQQKGKD